jgi:tetratricopeptide (TPR) repeat protein
MTCDYRAIQGANLIRLGRHEEAEAILTETLAIREALSDPTPIDLADLLAILAELYVETGRLIDAEQFVLRALSLVDDRVSATHLIRADLNETLGRVRLAQSQFDRSLQHFREAIDIRGKVQSSDHPSFARLLEAFANALAGVGDTVQASEQLARAEQIRSLYEPREE